MASQQRREYLQILVAAATQTAVRQIRQGDIHAETPRRVSRVDVWSVLKADSMTCDNFGCGIWQRELSVPR